MVNPRETLATAGGRALATTIGAWQALTRRTKPLHPRGELFRATLHRTGGTTSTGSTWLDEAGTDEVVVRRSRAIGLPPGLPDIPGLALSMKTMGARADVLFAGTGTGRVTRHVLLPAVRMSDKELTTLLPYNSDAGPVHLRAAPLDEQSYALSWASGAEWHEFAVLELGEPCDDGVEVSFDPVEFVPPGLRQYGWVRMLREPAYLAARMRSGRKASAGGPRAHGGRLLP